MQSLYLKKVSTKIWKHIIFLYASYNTTCLAPRSCRFLLRELNFFLAFRLTMKLFIHTHWIIFISNCFNLLHITRRRTSFFFKKRKLALSCQCLLNTTIIRTYMLQDFMFWFRSPYRLSVCSIYLVEMHFFSYFAFQRSSLNDCFTELSRGYLNFSIKYYTIP